VPDTDPEGLRPAAERVLRSNWRSGRRADGIPCSLRGAVAREGFREAYNPLTGRGHGARDFGWSTLLVDL
jgi:hypothetical protein